MSILSGKRPSIPTDLAADLDLTSIVEDSWAQHPSLRPSSRDIVNTLGISDTPSMGIGGLVR